MANRQNGAGAGKPPLYKIVMLGDSGVGKTSLGQSSIPVVNVAFRAELKLHLTREALSHFNLFFFYFSFSFVLQSHA